MMLIISTFLLAIGISTGTDTVSISLTSGWNLIGIPESMTASTLASKSTYITSIVHRIDGTNGYYQTYVSYLGSTEFSLSVNDGVYIYCTNAVTITFNRDNTYTDLTIIDDLTVGDDLTVTGEIIGDTGRAVTKTIAPSTASLSTKRQADIVCDGTDDQDDIMGAMANNTELRCLEGIFYFDDCCRNTRFINMTISGMGLGTIFKANSFVEGNLTLGASIGNSSVLTANASQFSIGMQVIIGTKDYTTKDKDYHRITNIIGNRVYINDTLCYAHSQGDSIYQAYRIFDFENLTGIVLKDFQIDGNKQNLYNYSQANDAINTGESVIFSCQNGIHLENCTYSRLDNIVVKDTAGWGAIVCYDGERNTITDCTVRTGTNHGLILFSEKYSMINNCESYQNGGSTTALGHNFCIEATYSSTITGCRSELAYTDGYYLWTTGGRLIVSNNACYYDPIGINMAIFESVISNNHIFVYGEDAKGIRSSRYNNTITGNNIEILNNGDPGSSSGIYIAGGSNRVENIVISNNVITIIGNAYRGIECNNNLKNILIDGNIITGECTYGYICMGGVLSASGTNIRITNNIIWAKDSPSFGIFIRRSPFTHSTVSGNTIEGMANPLTGSIYIYTGCNEGWTTETLSVEHFSNVTAETSDYVRNNQDLSASVPITFTIDEYPDCPRSLTWDMTHAQITEFTLQFTGWILEGLDRRAFVESVTEADGWSGETDHAFFNITSIKLTERTGTGSGDTCDIGIGSKLGLSQVIYADTDVVKCKKNGTDYSTASNIGVIQEYNCVDVSVGGPIFSGDEFTFWVKKSLNIIVY